MVVVENFACVALRGHAERAMRSKKNLTPISALVHSLKRNLKKNTAVWRLWALGPVIGMQIFDILGILA